MKIELLKSASQNQLGSPTTGMHLGKFYQSSATTNYLYGISEPPELGSSSKSAASTDPIFLNPYIVASTSSISLAGNPVRDSGSIASVAVPEFTPANGSSLSNPLQKRSSMDAMREMIFRIAMMQPIHIDPESVKPPRRKNVKMSKDPQSVAARHRRERISEKIRILQRLVPGGTKMDTASMLDEAAHYLKFLKKQVQSLEQTANNRPLNNAGIPMMMATSAVDYSNLVKGCQHQSVRLGSIQMLT
ncbi:uncharacterized protein [Coffea arabica]|uniref:BHLH domain-containing protein n=1 Tax=Coffea arabica TaxID=13443 RepID=A0A6P6TME3_COFAR|nr:transcription factor HEC1-like [Coffea arabica]